MDPLIRALYLGDPIDAQVLREAVAYRGRLAAKVFTALGPRISLPEGVIAQTVDNLHAECDMLDSVLYARRCREAA